MRRSSMAHTALPIPVTPDRLFCGCFPTGFVWADRAIEVDHNYKRIAYMSYETLELEVSDPNSPLLDMVRADAAKLQSQRGESYRVANMEVTLGG